MKTAALFLILTPILSLLGACAQEREGDATAPAYLSHEYAAFRVSMQACTLQTGYDPELQSALGPYELGAGELAWRDCAYSALMNAVAPNSPSSELYLKLIDSDRELTQGVLERRVSREQRDLQIASQRQQIIDREKAAARARSTLEAMEESNRINMITQSTHVLIRNTVPR
jgi:hypothetical protein